MSTALPPHRPVMIGSSHSWAIDRAARSAGVDIDQINFWNRNERPRIPDLSDLTPQVKARISQRLVFSTIGGAVPAQFGLCWHTRRFDFVMPGLPALELDEQADILPYHAVRSAVRAMADEDIVALRYTRAAVGRPIYHIEMPPPVAHEALIRPHIGPDLEIASAAFRYKFWLIYTRIIRAEVMAQGDTYIPHPHGVTEDHGYLLAEFHKDAVHGNDAYGALVVEQLRPLIAAFEP